MPSQDTVPFEASYEAAKQSIISYIGEVSQAYDIPIPLLNILIYEIALESRNASFSAIMGNCEVTYPEQQMDDNINKSNPTVIPKEKAVEGLREMGIKVNDTILDEPSTSKSA